MFLPILFISLQEQRTMIRNISILSIHCAEICHNENNFFRQQNYVYLAHLEPSYLNQLYLFSNNRTSTGSLSWINYQNSSLFLIILCIHFFPLITWDKTIKISDNTPHASSNKNNFLRKPYKNNKNFSNKRIINM